MFTMGRGNFMDDFKLNAIKQIAERDSGGGGIFTTSSSEGGIICSYELGVRRRDAPQE